MTVKLLILAFFLVSAIVLLGCQSAPAGPGNGFRDNGFANMSDEQRQLFTAESQQEAEEACLGKKMNDSCELHVSFRPDENQSAAQAMQGTCQMGVQSNEILMCRPERGSGFTQRGFGGGGDFNRSGVNRSGFNNSAINRTPGQRRYGENAIVDEREKYGQNK